MGNDSLRRRSLSSTRFFFVRLSAQIDNQLIDCWLLNFAWWTTSSEWLSTKHHSLHSCNCSYISFYFDFVFWISLKEFLNSVSLGSNLGCFEFWDFVRAQHINKNWVCRKSGSQSWTFRSRAFRTAAETQKVEFKENYKKDCKFLAIK